MQWIRGDATSLPTLAVDMATMTGNVAQVLLSEEEFRAALLGIRSSLRPGGMLAFEVRDPDRQGCLAWTRDQSERRTHVPGIGAVTSWVDLVDVSPPFVSFRWTYCFEVSGDVITSDSTLRFRSRSEIEQSVSASGVSVVDVRDAPDRPGLEFVFVCTTARDG